jgi:hypothetical protein
MAPTCRMSHKQSREHFLRARSPMTVISSEHIASLAGILGTNAGLAQVNAAIAILNHQLSDPNRTFSHEELADLKRALDSLGSAMLCMNRVTRELLGANLAGKVNFVS